jgi:hypothetical protein
MSIIAYDAGVADGKAEENARIIKLLEDSLSDELLACMVIALIKGEYK